MKVLIKQFMLSLDSREKPTRLWGLKTRVVEEVLAVSAAMTRILVRLDTIFAAELLQE